MTVILCDYKYKALLNAGGKKRRNKNVKLYHVIKIDIAATVLKNQSAALLIIVLFCYICMEPGAETKKTERKAQSKYTYI